MNKRIRSNHVIDAIFPIAVLFVFAVSALMVLILAARIYNSTTNASEEHFSARTSYAYVSEKVRQNDARGGISVEELEGITCLALSRKTDSGLTYITYIYALDGQLMELRVKAGVTAPLNTGTRIVAVEAFSVKELDDGRFEFNIIDEDGENISWISSERSKP